MEKNLLLILTVLLFACSQNHLMTHAQFDAIELGSPIETVVSRCGSPYAIHENKDGSQEYRYIERIPIGTEVVEENNYYIVIKNGQVVAKRFNQERPPAYDEIDDWDPNDVPN